MDLVTGLALLAYIASSGFMLLYVAGHWRSAPRAIKGLCYALHGWSLLLLVYFFFLAPRSQQGGSDAVPQHHTPRPQYHRPDPAAARIYGAAT